MSQSKKADIHDLYEKSVQNVEHEIEFMQETYMNIKAKRAYIYREDFCGTALSSYKWIKQGENFEAIAIDNDYFIIGAVNNDDGDTNTGSAYIFKRNTGSETWSEQSKLVASDPTAVSYTHLTLPTILLV